MFPPYPTQNMTTGKKNMEIGATSITTNNVAADGSTGAAAFGRDTNESPRVNQKQFE